MEKQAMCRVRAAPALLPKIQLKIYLLANDISRCAAAEVLHVRSLLLRSTLLRTRAARRAREVGMGRQLHEWLLRRRGAPPRALARRTDVRAGRPALRRPPAPRGEPAPRLRDHQGARGEARRG